MEDLSGKQLGPYQLIAPLGEGGMAVVYKAYQPSTERYVALKILPRQFASEPNFVKRFKQEAKIIAGLEHPNILPVYDYGEADGYTYIVMRYIEGGRSLADLMQGTPLPLSQIKDILSKLSAAIDYAHSRGVIHRDIKPSNVLIDQQGNLLLSDFGLAKMYSASSKLTTEGAFLGTPIYASPEQCLGRSDLDGRSDVYSLGVMLYEMATGKPPYDADTPMAVVLKHVNDPLPRPRKLNPDLPEHIETLILKALAKDRNSRYQTSGALARELETAVEHPAKTPPAPRETLQLEEEEREKKRRVPAWLWISGCLLAALIGIGVIVGTVWIYAAGTHAGASSRTAPPNPGATATQPALPPPVSNPTATLTTGPGSTATSPAGIPPTQPVSPPAVTEKSPHPAVAAGPNDVVRVAWADPNAGHWDVYLASSSDGGSTFGQPLAVDPSASPAREAPDLAIASDGRIYVAWEDLRAGNWDIYVATSEDGTAFSPALKVNDDGGSASQIHPALAVGSDGSVVLAWQDNRAGDWDIYAARLTDQGRTVGPNLLVNAVTQGDQITPDLGVDSQGNAHVVWADDQSGSYYVYYARSKGSSFSQGRAVGTGLMADLSGTLPRLVVGRDDRIHVAWADAYILHNVYQVPLYLPVYAVSTDGGDSFSSPRQAGSGYQYVSLDPNEIALAVSGATVHAILTTYSPRDGSLVWDYRSPDSGGSFKDPVSVVKSQGGDVMHAPAAAVDPAGGLHVVWAYARGNEWDIYYAKSIDGGGSFSTGSQVSGSH